MKNKKCPACGVKKPVSEFYKNKAQFDGYYYQCKSCAKLRSVQYSRSNEKRREYIKEYSKKYRKNGYKKNRNKEQCKAHDKIRHAIMIGQLEKPDTCSNCGSIESIQAHHHNGYENALDVIWVCHKCHMALHSKN